MSSRLKVLCLALCVTLSVFSAAGQSQDQSAKWKPLLASVQDVLAGRPIADTSITIAAGAYVVSGRVYEHLRAVADGRSKTCSLREDSSRIEASLTLKVNDAEDAAYLTLKTQSSKKAEIRYHTVIFMKDDKKHWVIETWHTSK